jgi:hypothetical protein
MFSISVEGMSEAKANLAGLPDAIQTKILRGALADAAKIVSRQAEDNARSMTGGTGRMEASIGTSNTRVFGPGVYGVSVETGKAWFKGQYFYAGFVEFGHVATGRKTIRGGTKRRRAQRNEMKLAGRFVPGRHFAHDAVEMKEAEATAAFVASVNDAAIEQMGRRLAAGARGPQVSGASLMNLELTASE